MLRLCALFVLILCAPAALAEPSGRIAVIDGDTWDVGGVRVRLHGIDAPEQDQTCTTEQGVPWACGAWVTDRVRALYQGRQATCRAVDRDRYGRIVARCTVAGADAGRRLVGEGLAFAYRRYSTEYVLDEKGAAVNDRGLHGSNVQSPAQFRRSQRAPDPAPAATPSGCAIKGNISPGSGEAIYHVPGQQHYDRTRISPEKGERWFCSEAEARAAGWRRARR